MHSYYGTTYFYVKTSYFDFINLAVGQRMNEIRRFGFLVTDSESSSDSGTVVWLMRKNSAELVLLPYF